MNEGLFISKCGGTLEQAIDIEQMSRDFSSLRTVHVVDDFFDPTGLAEMLEQVSSKQLDAVVLAGNSPVMLTETRSGEHLFSCFAERGIDRNRVEIVNLENMVIKGHKASRKALQQKARLLIEVGLEKVRRSPPLDQVEVAPRKAVAVVGASSGAIAIAQRLLDEQYKVFLLHKGPELILPQQHLPHLRPTLTAVLRHKRFKMFPDVTLTDFCGYTGDYTLKLHAANKEVELQVGAVVLVPDGDPATTRELQSLFHVDVDDKGSIVARDRTTAASLTLDRGVFLINPEGGTAASLSTCMMAADAAAAAVINLLNRPEIVHPVMVSRVDEHLCGGCGVCVKTCMFHAVGMRGKPRVSFIDPRRCRGCGNCVTACPSAARDLVVCSTDYLSRAVDILSGFSFAEPNRKVLLVACSGCGYRSLDAAAEAGQTLPIGILPLKVVCGGQIDTQLVLQAMVKGFDAVILLICGEGCCHHLIGNVDLERRANLLREVLSSRGLDHERMHIISTCSRQGTECINSIKRFYNELGEKSLALSTLMLS